MRLVITKSMGLGAYSPLHDELYLHPILLKYPDLLLKVYDHECGHAYADRNVLDALRRDLRDNLKLAGDKEAKLALRDIRIPLKKQILFRVMMVTYNIFHLPISIAWQIKSLWHK